MAYHLERRLLLNNPKKFTHLIHKNLDPNGESTQIATLEGHHGIHGCDKVCIGGKEYLPVHTHDVYKLDPENGVFDIVCEVLLLTVEEIEEQVKGRMGRVFGASPPPPSDCDLN